MNNKRKMKKKKKTTWTWWPITPDTQKAKARPHLKN
jgi:hypothetical protein